MTISEIISSIDTLSTIERVKLSTLSLLRISNELRLDWGFDRDAQFSDDYNEGATQAIVIKGIADATHPTNARPMGYSNNRLITSLVDGFIINNLLTVEKLNTIHTLIIKDGGSYRKIEVETKSGSKFTFSKINAIQTDVSKLVSWYNSKKDDPLYHPLFLAAEFHYRFVIIHPYVDGNGRLARIIASLILLKNKIPPPLFFSDERRLYIDRLKKADTGDFEPWFQLVGERVIRSLELLSKEIV